MINRLILTLSISFAVFTAQAEEIKLSGKDGFSLYGDFISANKKSAKGVLMLHQCNAERSMYGGLAKRLSDSGINSLSLDFRGFGDSTTEEVSLAKLRKKATSREHYFEMVNKLGIGSHRSVDVEIAYQYLLAKLGSNAKISLIGASCGGVETVILAQKHKPESFIFFSSGMDDETVDLFNKVSDVPALIIASQGDEYTFKSSNKIFLNAKSPTTRLLSYKGNGHGIPLFKQDPYLESKMADWFELNF